MGIALYRTTMPTANMDSLGDLEPIVILPPTATSYIDEAPAYREYYYTAMVRTKDGTEYTLVIPAVNATVVGVRPLNKVKEATIDRETASAQEKTPERVGDIRQLPLPYINLTTEEAPERLITKETEEAAVSLAASPNETPDVEPYVFRNEQLESLNGEELMLADIIQNQFSSGKYIESIRLLKEFLQLNRSKETTARSIFYLGEAYYFSGNYRSALTAFLQVQREFPELTSRWIQTTLDTYSLPEHD